jgi:hypothetical protein
MPVISALQEAEARRIVSSRPGLGYTARPCLKNQNRNEIKTKS